MSKLRKNLVRNNQRVFWEPAHIKKGRFGEFIREARDWALSRERYWGTPLPIWQCQKCGEEKCISSAKELGKKIKDLHRPYIDKIKLKCKCGGLMVRDKSVIDCWFDSGAMPFAQWGYPHKKGSHKKLKEYYPADYICEAVDQTRGWFYTLLAIATLMEYCGVVKDGRCYKNVICLGHVLDTEGKKMSKSRGNVVSPWEMCDKFGADTLRWYLYTVNSAGEPKKFDVKDVADKNRRFFGTLFNSFVFFQTYENKDFKPKKLKLNHVLDKWIISKFNSLNNLVVESLEKYDVVSAARSIENFVDDFSNWYIRRSRKRFQEASQTFYQILFNLSKLIAPFAPFISEEIYQGLKTNKDSKSVHLCDYPKPNQKLIDKNLESKMKQIREIVTLALAKRAQAGIKVRQPLSALTINNRQLIKDKDLIELIKDEVNIKKVIFGKSIKLDTKLTKELKQEGLVRDLIRSIQGLRKQAGLKLGQSITLYYQANPNLDKTIKNNIQEIKSETSSQKIELKPKTKQKYLIEKEIDLDEDKIWLGIK